MGTMQTQAGTKICCVARDGSRMAVVAGAYSFPIWIGGIYEAKARKDGKVTWRRVGSFGGTRSGRGPSDKFLAELAAAAPYEWSPDRVRHGDPA